MSILTRENIKHFSVFLLIVLVALVIHERRTINRYLVIYPYIKKMEKEVVPIKGKVVFQSDQDRDKMPQGPSNYLLEASDIKRLNYGGHPRFKNSNEILFSSGGKYFFDLKDDSSHRLPMPLEVVTSPDYDISSDGTQIAFVGRKQQKPSFWKPGMKPINNINIDNLYLINVDGTGLRQITFWDGRLYFAHPRWSPDGQKILFHASDIDRPVRLPDQEGPHYPPTLYMIDQDGTNLVNLLKPYNNQYGWDASWSPDGKKIVFTANNDNHYDNIFLLDLEEKKLTRSTNVMEHQQSPIFSPDGKQILFVGYPRGLFAGSELFVMNVDGTNVQRVTAPHVTKFGWSEIRNPDWHA